MIRRLLAIIPGDDGITRVIRWWVAASMLEAAGYALLVPVLRDLLDGDTGRAAIWSAIMAAAVIPYGLVRYRAQMVSITTATGLSRSMFHRIGDHVARLPLGWFDSDRVGEIGRLGSHGVILVMSTTANLIRPLVTAVVTPLTVVTIVIVLDWRLGLATLALTPLAGIVFRLSGQLVKRAELAHDAAAAAAGSRLVEFAQTQAVLRAHGRTVAGNALLDDALISYRNTGRRLMTASVPGLVAFAATLQIGFVAVLFVGVALATGDNVDAALLVALLVLVVRSMEPLVAASDINGALKVASNTLDRAATLLSTEPLAEGDATLADTDQPPTIEFERVGFSYRDETAVLTDIDLRIAGGTLTALVGPSGSGKTTIARLIARFWDVDSGTVRIEGIDIRDLTTEDLMSQISIVFQDTYLFAGTVADNLRLAAPNATDDELAQVASIAQLDEMLDRLPDGLDTDVGEGGTRLSGGERQRVSIARALLKDAPILLLDEATAAVDPRTELALQNAIDELRGERTIVVIAHRLQTVVDADQIAVLTDGRVAERGTHATLLRDGGVYSTFWTNRTNASGWHIAATSPERTVT